MYADERITIPTVTLAFLIAAALVTVYAWTSRSLSTVCYSGVASPSEWVYRFLMNELAHANMLHLLFNAVALVQVGMALEQKLSRIAYVGLLIFSALCTNALNTVYFLIVPGGCVLGASGIIFALFSFWCYGLADPHTNFCGFRVHAAVLPWASVALVQVFFWRAAWYGHVAGILSGTIAYFCVPKSCWTALGCDGTATFDALPISDDGGVNDSVTGQLSETVVVPVVVPSGTKRFEGKGHRLGGV